MDICSCKVYLHIVFFNTVEVVTNSIEKKKVTFDDAVIINKDTNS